MNLPADEQLDRLIRAGELSGAFFLYGDVLRLRDEGLRRLLEAALDPETRDFNVTYFRGGDVRPESLAAALAVPPMMASRRAVVLRDAEQLSPRHREVVLKLLTALPADIAFVISAMVPRTSKAAFYRTLKKRCKALEWKQPREQELPGWAVERARAKHGYELAADAAQMLAGAVGADLSILDVELMKLAGAAEDGTVSVEKVRELVPSILRVNRWEWLDRVATRHYLEALMGLETLVAGDRAVGLIAAMVDQHLYLGLSLEGGTDLVRKVMGEAGKSFLTWKARVYTEQARQWTRGELIRALRLMRRADRQLKSGGNQQATMEELLLALRMLCRRAA